MRKITREPGWIERNIYNRNWKWKLRKEEIIENLEMLWEDQITEKEIEILNMMTNAVNPKYRLTWLGWIVYGTPLLLIGGIIIKVLLRIWMWM